MKTLKTMLFGAVLVGSLSGRAAPRGDGPDAEGPRGGQKARVAMVVAIAEALELSEADALKMSEKLRSIEDRRLPMRAQMHEAMKSVRAAAEGDPAALAQVDANVQKVLDGRAQMAAMDKELFTFLAKDLPPQKRARLALVLAHLGQLRGGKQGRWSPPR
jgi:hypothetical protein